MISMEVLDKPSIEQQMSVSTVLVTGPSWMDPIITFLADGTLPNEAKELERL